MKVLVCSFLFVYFIQPFKAQSVLIDSKINGISLWSDDYEVEKEDFIFIKKTNANWVSVQPYGILKSDSTELEYDIDSTWETTCFKGLIKHIGILKEKGYKVFLKPHIMITYQKKYVWTGNLMLGAEHKWKTFEQSYERYIIDLAHIADSLEVDLFSLGTELGTYPEYRKESWKYIIKEVKSIYKGDITYCGNFDAYHRFPYWDKTERDNPDPSAA